MDAGRALQLVHDRRPTVLESGDLLGRPQERKRRRDEGCSVLALKVILDCVDDQPTEIALDARQRQGRRGPDREEPSHELRLERLQIELHRLELVIERPPRHSRRGSDGIGSHATPRQARSRLREQTNTCLEEPAPTRRLGRQRRIRHCTHMCRMFSQLLVEMHHRVRHCWQQHRANLQGALPKGTIRCSR